MIKSKDYLSSKVCKTDINKELPKVDSMKFIISHKNVINAENMMTRLDSYLVNMEGNLINQRANQEIDKPQLTLKTAIPGKRRKVTFAGYQQIDNNKKNEDSLNLSNIDPINKEENESFEVKNDFIKLFK